MIVAVPMPAPMHSVTSAVERSRRSNSSMTVPRIMAPVAPRGSPVGIPPAVDVDLGRIEIESLAIAQHHGCKRLVDFDEIDVVERHLRLRQNLLRHVNGPGQHDCGLRADIGERPDAYTRFQPSLFARLLAADQHRSGTADSAGRIARTV